MYVSIDFGAANSTLGALSSVAHLSVSMTMLMSSSPTPAIGYRPSSPTASKSAGGGDSGDFGGGPDRHNHRRRRRRHRQFPRRHRDGSGDLDDDDRRSWTSTSGSSSDVEDDTTTSASRTAIVSADPVTPQPTAIGGGGGGASTETPMSTADVLLRSDEDLLRHVRSTSGGGGSPSRWRSPARSPWRWPRRNRQPNGADDDQIGGRASASSGTGVESLPNVRSDDVELTSGPCGDEPPSSLPVTPPDRPSPFTKHYTCVGHSPVRFLHGLRRKSQPRPAPTPTATPSSTYHVEREETKTTAARSNFALETSDDDDSDVLTDDEGDETPPGAGDVVQEIRFAPSENGKRRQRRRPRRTRRQPSPRRTPDCRHRSLPSSPLSSAAAAASNRRRLGQTHPVFDAPSLPEASPINCSGVQIVLGDNSGAGTDDSTSGTAVVLVAASLPASVDYLPASLPSKAASAVASAAVVPNSLPLATGSTSRVGVDENDDNDEDDESTADFRSPTTPMSDGSQLLLLGHRK